MRVTRPGAFDTVHTALCSSDTSSDMFTRTIVSLSIREPITMPSALMPMCIWTGTMFFKFWRHPYHKLLRVLFA